MAKYNWS